MTTLALALLISAALVSAWHAAFWKRTRRIQNDRSWGIVRALSLSAAFVLWLGAAFLLAQFDLTRSGSWFCRVCGKCEERLEVLGLSVLERATPLDDPDGQLSRPFHDWFVRSVALEHEHDWVSSGCHDVGATTIACSPVAGGWPFYRSLPGCPDERVARALATVLVRAAPGRRTEMLDDFNGDHDLTNPFERISRRETLVADEFGEFYADWLARHPLWR